MEWKVGSFLDVEKAQKHPDQSFKWLLIFIQEKIFLKTSVVVFPLSFELFTLLKGQKMWHNFNQCSLIVDPLKQASQRGEKLSKYFELILFNTQQKCTVPRGFFRQPFVGKFLYVYLKKKITYSAVKWSGYTLNKKRDASIIPTDSLSIFWSSIITAVGFRGCLVSFKQNFIAFTFLPH